MTRSDAKGESKQSRRDFLLRAGATATGLVFAPTLLPERLGAAGAAQAALRIRDHRVGEYRGGGRPSVGGGRTRDLFSSRHPEELTGLVERAGSRTRAGFPGEAAEFGEVVLIAVPYAALPQVGRDYAPLMQGKVVIDCGNPYPRRDGPMAEEALAKGLGRLSRIPAGASASCARSTRSTTGRWSETTTVRSGFRSPVTTRMLSGSCRASWWTPASIRSWSGTRPGARIRSRHTSVRDRHGLRISSVRPWTSGS